MQRRPGVLAVDGTVLVGRLAALLADLGERALPDALEILVDGLGLSSAVLRATARPGAPGELLAAAGDVVQAVPHGRELRAVLPGGQLVEVPVHQAGRAVAALVVQGARPSQLPVLRTAAAVLGLALASRVSQPMPTAELALVEDAESDRDGLADALHDGPVQSLLVARYATDVAVRAGDPTGAAVAAREAVQQAVVDIRRAMWQLRPRAAADLRGALTELSARQVELGALPLDLDPDPASPVVLPGPAATTAYRLVQAVLSADAAVRVRVEGPVVEITGGAPLDQVARWHRRVRAVGGRLEITPGRLRLVMLPLVPDPARAPRPKATP